jgi:tubulin polyglutamylase TTLL9
MMHLTNVAIQKNADNYDDRLGGKWDLRSMKMFMISNFGNERVSKAFA